MGVYGYVRTSTDKQLTDRQVVALDAVCDEVLIEDGVSALSKKRPVYEALLARMQPGDVLAVLSFDRAFRSVIHALTELNRIHDRGLHFKSLTQNFDTTTPEGKLLFTIAIALGEWERDILSKRTKEGLAAARERGKRLGRPKKLSRRQVLMAHCRIRHDGRYVLPQVASTYRVHSKTLERALDDLSCW